MHTSKFFLIQFKKYLYFILLSVVVLTFSSCEKTKNQSESTTENSADFITLEEVNKLYKDFDSGKQFSKQTIIDSALYSKGKDTLGKEYALNLLKVSLLCLQNENNVPESEAYFKRFMKHPMTNGNPDFDIFYKITLADWYNETNEISKSRAIIDKILPKVSKEKNLYLYYYAKFAEGNILCEEYQFTKGIDLLIYVYENIKDKPEIGINKYSVLNNIGLNLNQIKKHDKAMEYLSLAHKETHKTNNLRDLYIIYGNMGNVLASKKKHKPPLIHY